MPEEEKAVHTGSDEPAAQEWGRSGAGDRSGKLTTPVPQVPETGPQLLMFGALHRRAQQSLMESLLSGEHPLVVVPGAAGSGIIGTESRALVLKAGARSGAPFSGRCKAFEYESVIGIRLDTETSPAVVAIDAPHKIGSCRVYWADPRDDPWKARNAIPIEAAGFGVVLEQVLALRGLIEDFRRQHPALSGPATTGAGMSRVGRIPPESDEGAVVAPLPLLTGRCTRCREELRPGWRFCPECGTPAGPARGGQSK
jgi:zinc-ribbon domain